MKQLISPGITIILPSYRRTPPGPYQNKSGKPWTQNLRVLSYVELTATLKSGVTYLYAYSLFGDTVAPQTTYFTYYVNAATPQHTFPTGGEMFNYLGRNVWTCWAKVVVP